MRDAVDLELRGWYGVRRARLSVTDSQVLIVHAKGHVEIARGAINRVRCSTGIPLDKVSFSTREGVHVFRVGDVTPFASWLRRSRLARHIDIDSDVMEAVREAQEDEREQEQFRTVLAADGGLLTANIVQRLVARFVDLLVVFALASVVILATASSDDAFIALIFTLLPAYEIPLVAFFGCSVGKLWPSRIRVVSVKSGRPPGLLRATVRILIVWPAMLLGRLRFVLPDAAAGWLDGLHDRAARTVVLSTSALRVLHDHPEADWPDLLADAQRRQLAGLAAEEHELASDDV